MQFGLEVSEGTLPRIERGASGESRPLPGGGAAHGIIVSNSEILGGTPVFAGTRVPVRILMECLEAGDRLDDFLDEHPTVAREQAVAVLERATAMLVSDSIESAA